MPRGLLAGSMMATSQLLSQFLHTPCFPYPGTFEHKGQKIWIKPRSWRWQARKEKASVMLSQWLEGWYHRWQLSALIVTEGEEEPVSRRLLFLTSTFMERGKKVPDRASNRLGKLSWVPGQGTCTGGGSLPQQWPQGFKAFYGLPKDATSCVSE